jgi:hypothetical protein
MQRKKVYLNENICKESAFNQSQMRSNNAVLDNLFDHLKELLKNFPCRMRFIPVVTHFI